MTFGSEAVSKTEMTAKVRNNDNKSARDTRPTLIEQVFFRGAEGQLSRKLRPEQDIHYRRRFSRADGVVERLIEPKKTFVGRYSKATYDDFIGHFLSAPQKHFESRVRAGCF